METHFPPLLIDASADDMLAVLRDMHRQQCQFDVEANPDVSLAHGSTVAEWRDACHLVSWRGVASAMNAYWSVTIPMAEWCAVLEPSGERRLRGVCELLARHVKLPRVRAATVLGSKCLLAGVFLTVRSMLADAGADVGDVAPSTELAEYARQNLDVFLGPVSRLAPGTLPPVKVRTPVYDVCCAGALVGFIGTVAGWWTGWAVVSVVAVLVFAASYAGAWIAARWMLPSSVEFGRLATFRDLSIAIARGHNGRRD